MSKVDVLLGLQWGDEGKGKIVRSEEHTSELQSRPHLVCRLLLEKKKDRAVPTSYHQHERPLAPSDLAVCVVVAAYLLEVNILASESSLTASLTPLEVDLQRVLAR